MVKFCVFCSSPSFSMIIISSHRRRFQFFPLVSLRSHKMYTRKIRFAKWTRTHNSFSCIPHTFFSFEFNFSLPFAIFVLNLMIFQHTHSGEWYVLSLYVRVWLRSAFFAIAIVCQFKYSWPRQYQELSFRMDLAYIAFLLRTQRGKVLISFYSHVQYTNQLNGLESCFFKNENKVSFEQMSKKKSPINGFRKRSLNTFVLSSPNLIRAIVARSNCPNTFDGTTLGQIFNILFIERWMN